MAMKTNDGRKIVKLCDTGESLCAKCGDEGACYTVEGVESGYYDACSKHAESMAEDFLAERDADASFGGTKRSGPKQSQDDALRTLNQHYMAEVRSLADQFYADRKDNGDLDLSDWLHEAIDGHQFIIYTHQARIVMVCTENPEAWSDVDSTRPSTVEGEAYWAMRADVERMIDALRRDHDDEDEE